MFRVSLGVGGESEQYNLYSLLTIKKILLTASGVMRSTEKAECCSTSNFLAVLGSAEFIRFVFLFGWMIRRQLSITSF